MLRRNPSKLSKHALLTGDPFDDVDLNAQWVERGVIVAINTNTLTCDVETERHGRLLGLAFPDLEQDPIGSGGRIKPPREGQAVIVQQGLGFPIITGFYPIAVDKAAGREFSYEIPQGGNAAAVFPTSGPSTFLGKLPTGTLPGDDLRFGNQGQYMGLMDGGVAVMYSSPWAQIFTTPSGDTTQIVGRNLKIFTGFGEVVFDDSGGKQALTVRGGLDQKTETGAGKQNWGLEMSYSSKGSFDFRMNDRIGNATYKKTISPAGSVDESLSGPQAQTYKGEMILSYEKGRTLQINESDDLRVLGDRLEEIQGSLKTSVSQNRVMSVLSDRSDNINRDWTMSVGRSFDLMIGGDLQKPLPTTNASKWMIHNGSWVVDVGQPPTDLQTAQSSIRFTTYGALGNIEYTSLGGEIDLIAGIDIAAAAAARIRMTAGAQVTMDAGAQMALKAIGEWSCDGAIVRLGGVPAIESVVRGTSFLSALATFLAVVSAAGKGVTVFPSPPTNAGALATISGAADAFLAQMANFPSAKVFTV